MGPGDSGTPSLSGAVRVVPDVPSFAVDDGFAYAVPDGMTLAVGSVVRVPLGGRRVRGWVVGGERERPGLRSVLSTSGNLPVFGVDTLEVLRWAAAHYVAPLAAVLSKTSPPNVARGVGTIPQVRRGDASSRRLVVAPLPWTEVIAAEAEGFLRSGRSVMVVCATVVEAEALATSLGAALGMPITAVSSGTPAAEITRRWVEAATRPGTLLIGTREVVFWPVAALGLVVLADEGRRGMKDRATPTVHARDLVLKRAEAEGFATTMLALVPSAEAVLRATDVVETARPWGLVEVVDRSVEAPGRSLFSEMAAAALRASGDRRVLVFTHRRTVAQRCVRCRLLRACPACGAAPGESEVCPRCSTPVPSCTGCGGRRFESLGAGLPRVLSETARIVPRDEVGPVDSGRRVVVGSERDLPGLEVDLTIVVDGDGPVMAPHYRATEDGLRLLGRAAAAAGRGPGRRALVQTSNPSHPVMRALVAGAPVPVVRSDAGVRSALGFPPAGEIIALEATGLEAAMAGGLGRLLGGRASVHGPAPAGEGLRWLIQGPDLAQARAVLRRIVGQWREAGVRVRIDADPTDL